MTTSFAELQTSAAKWLAAASRLPERSVVLGTGTPDTRRARLPRPYAMLTLTSPGNASGQEEREAFEIDGHAVVRHIGQRVARADVQVFGPGAYDFLERCRKAVWRQSFQDLATELGIAVNDVEDPQVIPTLLDTEYEERAISTITFSYRDVEEDALSGTIEQAVATASEVKGASPTISIIVDTSSP